jgi:hypothetical protein
MSISNKHIEEIILICSTKLPACQKLLDSGRFKLSVMKLQNMKMLTVDDEHTRNLLMKANVYSLPLLLLKIEEDVLEVKNASYILKVLEEINKNHQPSTEKEVHTHVMQMKPPETISVDASNQLFKAQMVYKTDNIIISYIGCEKFVSMDNKFDLTIVSENCRKVHFENENYVLVNVTNISSLKTVIPILLSKYEQKQNLNILTVSRTKRLADIISAMCMFYIQHNTLDEIQASTTISRKILMELFTTEE